MTLLIAQESTSKKVTHGIKQPYVISGSSLTWLRSRRIGLLSLLPSLRNQVTLLRTHHQCAKRPVNAGNRTTHQSMARIVLVHNNFQRAKRRCRWRHRGIRTTLDRSPVVRISLVSISDSGNKRRVPQLFGRIDSRLLSAVIVLCYTNTMSEFQNIVRNT